MNQNQHYIAQKQLSYWSEGGGKVYRCDLRTGEIKHLPTLSIAKRKNQWAQEVENPIFSGFEGQYAKVIEHLEARREITKEIESYLKNLQAILFSRVPKQKKNTDRMINEMSEIFQHTPTLKDYTRAMATTIKFHNLFKSKAYAVIMVAFENRTFVMTDNPASLYLPLTPRMCLFTPNTEKLRDKNKRYPYVDEDFVKMRNKENIERADRYVFSLEKEHPDVISYLEEKGLIVSFL